MLSRLLVGEYHLCGFSLSLEGLILFGGFSVGWSGLCGSGWFVQDGGSVWMLFLVFLGFCRSFKGFGLDDSSGGFFHFWLLGLFLIFPFQI